MSYTVVHKEFSGPLDLLLALIENREKEITDLALADVTEDFLAYIDQQKGIRTEEFADFLVIAAKLLLLKSQALLPVEAVQEEDGVSLEEQLRLYKQFVEVAKVIDTAWNSAVCAYGRPVKPEIKPGFYPPENIQVSTMTLFLKDLLDRLEYFRQLPERALARVFSIKEKIASIRTLLARAGKSTMQEVLAGSKQKGEIIVTFLALLELVKQREVTLRQHSLFSDIHIE